MCDIVACSSVSRGDGHSKHEHSLAGLKKLCHDNPINHHIFTDTNFYYLGFFLNILCALTQLLFQLNALVFIKSTRYYNLYFLSLYS
jgi:hypothetical protein